MGDISIGVLIVDDHAFVADSLAVALREDPALEVLGIATTAAEAEGVVATTDVDVVLMDFRLPDGDGAQLAGRVRSLRPSTRVLMLTGYDDVDVLSRCIDAGCAGFLHKTAGLPEVVEAVRSVHRGDTVFPAEGLADLVRALKRQLVASAHLTEREREVLTLMGEGASTEAIAERLDISKHTTRSHVRNILAKLDAHSKLEAVIVGLKLGLVGVREGSSSPVG